jgi:hypothetical protein
MHCAQRNVPLSGLPLERGHNAPKKVQLSHGKIGAVDRKWQKIEDFVAAD